MYRVIVIDDEPDILTAVCSVLETCTNIACEVKGVVNPLIALEDIRQNPSAYDIVLTDIRMPRMMGFELAKKIKEIKPEIKIAFMSAFNVDERMPGYPKALRKEHVLRKPDDLLKLCNILEKFFVSST